MRRGSRASARRPAWTLCRSTPRPASPQRRSSAASPLPRTAPRSCCSREPLGTTTSGAWERGSSGRVPRRPGLRPAGGTRRRSRSSLGVAGHRDGSRTGRVPARRAAASSRRAASRRAPRAFREIHGEPVPGHAPAGQGERQHDLAVPRTEVAHLADVLQQGAVPAQRPQADLGLRRVLAAAHLPVRSEERHGRHTCEPRPGRHAAARTAARAGGVEITAPPDRSTTPNTRPVAGSRTGAAVQTSRARRRCSTHPPRSGRGFPTPLRCRRRWCRPVPLSRRSLGEVHALGPSHGSRVPFDPEQGCRRHRRPRTHARRRSHQSPTVRTTGVVRQRGGGRGDGRSAPRPPSAAVADGCRRYVRQTPGSVARSRPRDPARPALGRTRSGTARGRRATRKPTGAGSVHGTSCEPSCRTGPITLVRATARAVGAGRPRRRELSAAAQ